MTTETSDSLNAEMDTAIAWFEGLKGASVQINHDCLDPLTGNLHMWAGKHGTLTGANPFGAALIAVGNKTKTFERDDFTVTAPAGAAPGEPALKPAYTGAEAVRLVNAPPLHAINSQTNPRRRRGLDLDSLRALADSILAHGLGNPILVRPLPAARVEETSDMDPRPAYEVIAGERRWRAAQLAELAEMPMFVRHMDDQAVLEMQLVENIEREDLDAMEEAEGFALLRDKLGYTVEQIAQRMGKGRGESYVRKRMKLLDLTPASREAMYDGTLQLSTGLLVSRMSEKDQVDAVKLIKSMERSLPGDRTEPAPYREVVRALFNKFHLVLDNAPFDIQDPGLVLTAGACSSCPKRTGANPDLFGDADHNAENQCTDSACWGEKKTAHVARAVADAKARGLTVMDESEAEKLLPSPYTRHVDGYEKLTDTAYIENEGTEQQREVTYADALRAQGRKAPKPTVVIHPHTGKVFEVIPEDVAEKLVPSVSDDAAPKGDRPPAHQAPERSDEHRALLDTHVRRALFYRLFESVRQRPRTLDDLRLAAIGLMCQTDDAHPHTEAFMGWSECVDADDPQEWLREKIDGLDADQLGQLITMAAMEQAVDWYNGHISSAAQEQAFFESHGLDILAVRDKVQEDLQRQQSQPQGGEAAAGDQEGSGEGEGDEA